MIPILDWIFEGIVGWIASIVSQLFDAVSGLFLEALGTDMTAMEEYFPFVTKAYDIMQVTAWAILILIVVWQLFRAFGGPITEAENPWHLLIRGAIFAFLIGYAKPIFTACLSIARAPYTSLMDVSMTGEDFTFAGIEQALTSGLTTIVSVASVIGLILILILEIALGWNYFKLLLETVERYIVVGVLCYTSPLAFSVGGSKATNTVFRSWCRMVGSQLLLLVMNVWFLRGFASSMGQFIANGGALTTGKGSIFLWMFCALAYLKCAQRFDSYLASIGLNVAQTGSSMGMELLMAARVLTGAGGAARSAGSVFSRGGSAATGTGAAASGFAAGFASKFSPNSYVRDAVVDGGTRMGFGGGAGFVARAFGGIAARNGATLNGDSIASVAGRSPNASGMIAGDIADRSLSNYMPHMKGFQMQGTQITGGHISTTATTPDGKKANVDMYSASQFEKPDAPHSVVTASDGSQWYQMASGEGRGAFYDAPVFGGMNAQPGADGVNTDPANPAVGETVPGTETPGVQTPADGTPVSESIVPGAEGMPQGVSTFPGDQIHDVPGMSDGIQGEGFVPGGNQMPEAGAEEDVPGMVGQPIEGGQLGVMPSGDPGGIAEQIPASEAEGQAFGAAFIAAPGAEMASAELGADPGDIPHSVTAIQGDGIPTDGMEMPQGGAGFMPELVPNQIPGDSITGAGEIPSASGGEHIISAPAEGGMEVPQTGSGFVPELVGQPEAPAAIGGTDMPGITPGEQSVPVPAEGGMDAPEFGAAFVGAGSDGHIIAFPGVSSEVPGDSISGSTEGGGEIPHQVPGFVGGDVGGAGVQPETGVIPGSTEMPVSHDAGHEAPQFAAGVSGAFYGADHSAGSDGDSFHGGDQHNGHPVQGDDSPGYSGGYSQGGYAEAPLVAATFPSAQEGTMLRTVGDGVIEASSPDGGNTLWYNSAYYQEPDAPHSVMEAANGVQWYAMQQQAHAPRFESGENAVQYNQAAFQNFMPGYEGHVAHVDGTHRLDGHFEVRNADGSGTAFFDTACYAAPRGDYQVLEDARGAQWYAIRGEAAVDRKPVYENGQAVYDDGKDGVTYNHVEVLYGIDKNIGADLLNALGLPKGAERYTNADQLDSTKYFYQSDVLIDALELALQTNSTNVKNALERYIAANGGTAMPLTDSYGKSQANDLDLGLYLVIETKVPEMVTSTCNPFFVSIPMTSVNGTNATDGGTRWIYDVTIYPKNLTGIPSLEKTLRENVDDTGKHEGTADDITDGYAHTGTASDGDIIDYQLISTLPSITSESTYLTEYTFIDTLSAGLSYNKKDIIIEFFSDAACTDLLDSWDESDGMFTATYSTTSANESVMTIKMTAAGLQEINTNKRVYTGASMVKRGGTDCTIAEVERKLRDRGLSLRQEYEQCE